MTEPFINRDFSSEFVFSSSRSSGPGGQNVNKVNTKVELRFSVNGSALLTDDEKLLLATKLKNKINADGELIITAQTERSQLKNKDLAIEKFYLMVQKALTPVKKRRATRPTASSIERRLQGKKASSEKKTLRRKIDE